MSGKRGRPTESTAGSKRQVCVWLRPEEIAALEARQGSAVKGLRAAVAFYLRAEDAPVPEQVSAEDTVTMPVARGRHDALPADPPQAAPVAVRSLRSLCPRCTRIGVPACAACCKAFPERVQRR